MSIEPAAHVRDPRKYYDRTVQEWHMAVFPEACTAIDMDLGGYCRDCYAWLYFIEAAETWLKPTGLVTRLAMAAGCPSLLVVHAGGAISGARRVWPDRSERFDERHLFDYCVRLRRAHATNHLRIDQENQP